MATVNLYPRQQASGDLPLVLLPPFPCDARIWAEVADTLGGDVITVDPPGFGGEVDDDPALEGYARAVLAALDARGVDRFVLAGNSMGGYAALCLAELAPERVAGIGLVGTKSTADTDEARSGRLAMADAAEAGEPLGRVLAPLRAKLLGESTQRERPEVADELDDIVADATPAGVAWAQRAMAARPDRTAVLTAFGGPAVVIGGAEDPLMDAASQAHMAEALGVRPITMPVGHLLPFEAPDAVMMELRRLWRAAAE